MIVRIAPKLSITLGRVDEDGEVVNLTSLEYPLLKLCDEEFLRVCGEVQAKQDEVTRSIAAIVAAQVVQEPMTLQVVSAHAPGDEQGDGSDDHPHGLDDLKEAIDAGDTDDLRV